MSDYFERIERQLTARVAAGDLPGRRWPMPTVTGLRPRALSGLAVAAASAAVVIAVVLVALVSPGSDGGRGPAAGPPAALDIPLQPVAPVSPTRLQSARAILAARLAPVLPRVTVAVSGGRIVIRGVSASRRALALALAGPGRLTLFDWEASVIGPNGDPIASSLRAQDRAAFTLSQGIGSAPAGTAGAGALPLAGALALVRRATRSGVVSAAAAAARPVSVYLVGRARSTACALAAAVGGFTAPSRGACLLAGPATSTAALNASLPGGVKRGDGDVVTVPAGYALLQASGATGSTLAPGDPRARFFVVRGPVAVTGAALRDPTASRDQSGSPDVQFQFTPAGARAFQTVTAAVAHRGQLVSAAQMNLNQHFAIALDGRVLSVPQIDSHSYPDGINTTGQGADLTGGFTRASARSLAAVLARGPLPVALAPR